ncbi:feruloyl-CoA synthase [Roseicyclus amphidinii]|uniref:feruloyl-CoA synthase n=1 Tax=Roseicyclus amphidinii TaxID=3034232 RepID=UPI0024E0C899|nr:feruloyl-CoA synthase [Roseicyclus sp. Amp-Y-6]
MLNRTTTFAPHRVEAEHRADGTILLRAEAELGPVARCTGDWLHRWAAARPDHVFLAERHGAGWREESYAGALDKVRALAAALLGRGMGPKTPILVISGNGVDHGLLALAAQYVGVPLCPVAEQYALVHGAHGRLVHAVELIRPRMIYAVDAGRYAEALALPALEGIEIVCSRTAGRSDVTGFDTLLKGDASADVDAAHSAVTPDTVGKILMTSGSTSAPKGVLTTHRMMCVNQAQLVHGLPFLEDRPPVLVDWLPWNHVFGGSHNFNMALSNGGTLYIDDGKPVAGLFERTLENLSMVAPTLSFNVPLGYAMLVAALKKDAGLRGRFFADLDLMFYAGASIPQEVWTALEAMAMEVKGEVPLMTSSWGLTETAPAVLLQQEPTDRSGVVGVPLPGAVLKLIPDADMRCEVRVKGPNVMPGYVDNPEKTAEAFDEEGYFVTGDAMVFVDPRDVSRGLRFDGRISEDFKLLSGTWVRAAQLRIDMLACLSPLAGDLVVTGADRSEIGLLIFPDMAELKAGGFALDADRGALSDPRLLSEIHRRLAERARAISGSSSRVARALVLAEPASMPEGEMTAKGNLNSRRVLTRRAELLTRLYAQDDPCVTSL